MFVISKGELWTIRAALEEVEAETTKDALSIIESVLDTHIKVDLSEGQSDKRGIPLEPTGHKIVPIYAEEEEEDIEEEHRVC